MEKLLSAKDMIEADYRLLCEARQDALPRSGSRWRRTFLYLAVLLILSFPVFI